jgi:hypothetical protein
LSFNHSIPRIAGELRCNQRFLRLNNWSVPGGRFPKRGAIIQTAYYAYSRRLQASGDRALPHQIMGYSLLEGPSTRRRLSHTLPRNSKLTTA